VYKVKTAHIRTRGVCRSLIKSLRSVIDNFVTDKARARQGELYVYSMQSHNKSSLRKAKNMTLSFMDI